MMPSATLRRAVESTAASGWRSGCPLGWEDSREGVSSNTHTQDQRKEDSRLGLRYDMSMVTMGSRRHRGAAPWKRGSDGACTPRIGGAGQHGWRLDAAMRPLSASEVALLEGATFPRRPIALAAAPQPRGGRFIIASGGDDAGYYYSNCYLLLLPSPEEEGGNGATPRMLPELEDNDYRTRETPERRENPPTLSLADGTQRVWLGSPCRNSFAISRM